MKPRTFDQFKDLVYQKSGITLGPQKVALVSARIAKRMRALGLQTHEDYFHFIVGDESAVELVHLLDSISTNVTSFYREPVHFDILADLVREWRVNSQPRFRIWCAASSTGEEPYTLAMTVLEALGGPHPDFRLLATDISTRVLETARRGVYGAAKVEPVPRPMLQKYFRKLGAGPDADYQIGDELKQLVTFNRLNLSEPPFPMKGPFDVVFCRNVMIYFDNEVRRKLVLEISRLLKPGGYLMIGHSESLSGIVSPLTLVQPAVYRKASP